MYSISGKVNFLHDTGPLTCSVKVYQCAADLSELAPVRFQRPPKCPWGFFHA